MPAFTSFLNLYKPGGGSTGLILPDEVVDIDRINANMDVIDLFAKGHGDAANRNIQFTGPAAALAGLTGMKEGDTYQETDAGKRKFIYVGTQWILDGVGLLQVTVAGAQSIANSVDTDVVFTGATPVTSGIQGFTIVVGTGVATCTIPGMYRIYGTVAFAAGGSSASHVLGVAKNNVHQQDSLQVIPGTEIRTMTVEDTLTFALNDTVRLKVLQASGGAKNIFVPGGQYNTKLIIERLGAV